MTKITVMLNDQDLTIVQKPLLASGDKETVILHADFSTEWDGYTKTGVFYQDESNVYHAVLNSIGECEIPWEAMQTEGAMYFGIFGIKNSTRKTSEVVKYRIKKGAWSVETSTSDPTPDIYTQIMSAIAPLSGYGLGEKGQNNANIECTTLEALDGKTNNGFWVYKNANSPLIEGDNGTKYVKGITLAYNNDCITQIGFCNSNGKCIIREKYTTWGEWGYPPEKFGAVPTTRKINGIPLSADFNLSASNVGAVDATSNAYSTVDDLNALCNNGFWKYTNPNEPLISGNDGTRNVKGITIAYNSDCVTQIGTCNETGIIIAREKYGASNDKWGEWGLLNPRMTLDREYRTLQKWNGKAVYTALVDMKKVYDSGATALTTNFTATEVFDFAGSCNGRAIPYFYDKTFTHEHTIFGNACLQNGKVRITVMAGSTSSSNVGHKVYVQVWYVKD